MNLFIMAILSDKAFCDFFVKKGGGFNLDKHVLKNDAGDIDKNCMNRVDWFKHWCLPDQEWLLLEHRYWPSDKFPNGETMHIEDIKTCLKARNLHLLKIWRFYVAYLNKLPPMSYDVDVLLSSLYSKPWGITK